MSKYGIDYYGAAYYGSNSLVTFSAAPFLAVPYDYSAIRLTWATPTGDWDYLRLIRNPYGFPVTADDGDVLFEDEAATSRASYFDTGTVPNNIGLKAGNAYYYSIFVRETVHSTWKIAGNAIGISVKNYNTTELMVNYLPTILTSQVPYDSSVEQDNDFLKRFLKLFALSIDLYKTQAESISNRYDITNLNGSLIPVFLRQFGFKYEPELGLKHSRNMLNNAIRLYKNKGSKLGLEEYVKTYAGYDNVLSMGKNLMLDNNDSSFEHSIGSWASVSSCSLARHSIADSPTIIPYEEPTAQANFPNLQTGTLQVTGTASATAEIALFGDSALYYGIPVNASTSYTFSGYSQTETTARSVTALIAWYDAKGVLLSTSTAGSGVSNTAGSWNRFSKTATSPTGAYFAVPHIKIANTVSSEKHYFDAFQFEANASATAFQDARQIEITLIASRVNELLNPNFEDSTDYWNVNNGSFLLTVLESEAPSGDYAAPISGGAVEVYAAAAGTVTVTSDSMGVYSGSDYTFSIYTCSLEVGTSYDATVFIKWYDSSDVLISTDTSDTFTTEPVYSRPYITATSPNNAVTAVVGFTWEANAINDEIALDAALFEKSAFVNSFFDGSSGVAELADLFWENNSPNAARSHYYINRFAVQSRLIDTLPNWINLGSTFELLFAQPET